MFVHPDWPQSIDNVVVHNNNDNNNLTVGFLSAHIHQLNTNSIPEIIINTEI